MQRVGQESSNAYQHLPDEEIASLYVQFDSLTEPARKALASEIQGRGLTGPQLQKITPGSVVAKSASTGGRRAAEKAWRWVLFCDKPAATVIGLLLAGVSFAPLDNDCAPSLTRVHSPGRPVMVFFAVRGPSTETPRPKGPGTG